MLIGYSRVSTTDQDPALQTKALKEAGCEQLFSETTSGASRNRPELKAALDYMRDGDVLCVWKLDRLGRSLKQLLETIENLERRGIGFRSLTEGFDTTTAGGRMIFHVFGALAEFERSMIRERTCAGLDAARARGRVGGRPRALSKKQIEMAKASIVLGKLSIGDIAGQLNVSATTIYRSLPVRELRQQAA